jgi:hypothetical protein
MSIRYQTLLILLLVCSACRADDTAFLQALLARPNEVHRLAGEYTVSKPLVLHRTSSIAGDNATIICRDAGDNAFATKCLSCTGDVPELLGSDFSATQATDSTLATTATGDMLCVFNSAPSSYSAYRAYYHAGEFARVASPGRIVGSWMASYADCQLYRYNAPARCRISGLTICYEGPLAPCVLEITRGRDVLLRDVVLSGSSVRLCQINQTLGATVDNCRFEALYPDSVAVGLNYGLVIANSQEVRVSNSTMTAVRHALTAGGDEYVVGIPVPVNRLIGVANCDLYSTYNVAACDFHGNCEHYSVIGCRIHGGVDVGGNRGKISNNTIISRDESQAGVAIYATEWTGCDHSITDNDIHAHRTASYSGRGAFYLNIFPSTMNGGTTYVTGNRLTVTGTLGTCPGIYIANHGSQARWRLAVSRNTIKATVPAPSLITYYRNPTAAKFVIDGIDSDNILTGGLLVKNAGDFAP